MKKRKYQKPKITSKKLNRFFFNCKTGGCSTRINKALISTGTCRC